MTAPAPVPLPRPALPPFDSRVEYVGPLEAMRGARGSVRNHDMREDPCALVLFDSQYGSGTMWVAPSNLRPLVEVPADRLDRRALADALYAGVMGGDEPDGTYRRGAVNFRDDEVDAYMLADRLLAHLRGEA